jgi:hypothetical protein
VRNAGICTALSRTELLLSPPRRINVNRPARRRVDPAAEFFAWLYGVEVKALNQAVKRNEDRFPPISCSSSPARRLRL